jgi:hypothetical protein
MSLKEQVSANRNSIAIAVAAVLFAALMAYSNGWFGPSAVAPEPASSKVSASQTMERENMRHDSDKVTLKTTKRAGQTTE